MTNKLREHLLQLAHELQRAELWEAQPPSPERLASSEPFCVDTLAFEQWLQWVFIPRLSALVASPNFSGLPNPSAIHAMAEQAFKDYPQDTQAVCEQIQCVDKALNAFLI